MKKSLMTESKIVVGNVADSRAKLIFQPHHTTRFFSSKVEWKAGVVTFNGAFHDCQKSELYELQHCSRRLEKQDGRVVVSPSL